MKEKKRRNILRLSAALLACLVMIQFIHPVYAYGQDSAITAVSSADEDDFKEKDISPGSVNKSGKYKAGKITTRKADRTFTKAAAGVSIKLLKETLKKTKGNKNVLISPDSIITAAMIMGNGARADTRSEVEKAFGKLSIKKYNQYLAFLAMSDTIKA